MGCQKAQCQRSHKCASPQGEEKQTPPPPQETPAERPSQTSPWGGRGGAKGKERRTHPNPEPQVRCPTDRPIRNHTSSKSALSPHQASSVSATLSPPFPSSSVSFWQPLSIRLQLSRALCFCLTTHPPLQGGGSVKPSPGRNSGAGHTNSLRRRCRWNGRSPGESPSSPLITKEMVRCTVAPTSQALTEL